MVYQHRFLHVFMSLFFFYVLACLLSVTIYLLSAARALYFDIMTNPYVWMLYAPGPLFVGMSLSLLFAGIVQWVYRCKLEGNRLTAKDTWGRDFIFDVNDIKVVQSFAVPFMPISRIKTEKNKWSAWVPKAATLELIGNTDQLLVSDIGLENKL